MVDTLEFIRVSEDCVCFEYCYFTLGVLDPIPLCPYLSDRVDVLFVFRVSVAH